MKRRKAFITGISGQDGSYLAELLLEKDYDVHGLVRRNAIEDPERRLWRLSSMMDDVTLHPGSVENYAGTFSAIRRIGPDEIYHLAAESFVGDLIEAETASLTRNIEATHVILAASLEIAPRAKFYFAGSSEMFGDSGVSPQNEESPFFPRTAYGISKLAGYHLVRGFRRRGLFAVSGILYNHESPRRGFEFVTRKITSQAARIKLGLADELRLGNLEARRDWGHAKDYVRAIWQIVQQERPSDYVIATGRQRSVHDFLDLTFSVLELPKADHVVEDPQLFRAEGQPLVGDISKARRELGWEPRIGFEEMVREMVDADLDLARRELSDHSHTPESLKNLK